MRLPQDSFGQYDILESYFPSPSPGDLLVVGDPNCIQVLISTGTSVSTLSAKPAGAVGQWGLALSSNAGPFGVYHALSGPLASVPWYCSVPAGPAVTVIQVFLRRQPIQPVIGHWRDVSW